jgi:hypothetical protein
VLVKGREIVWELTELNFRADFQAIDEFMHVNKEATEQNCFQSWKGWREIRLSTINRWCWPDTAVDVDLILKTPLLAPASTPDSSFFMPFTVS